MNNEIHMGWFFVGDDGWINVVRCKVCSKVKCKDKIFVPMLDSLFKHVVKKKSWNKLLQS
jgi:hypothetical protein